MPEWMTEGIIIALIGVGGIILGLLGSLITVKMTAKKNKTDLQLQLVDQLQEERDRLDTKLETQEQRHAADVEKLNIRITGFYADKSASRKYIASLESHIYQGNPPPPPAPPDGYVP